MWSEKVTALSAADTDQSRRQYMTSVILTMMLAIGLICTVPVIVGWLVGTFDLESVFTFLLMDGLIGAGWWLARRGRWRPGSFIAPAVMLAVAVYGTYFDGLNTHFVIFYVIVILLVSVLQGGKAQWFALALCIVTHIGIGVLRDPDAPDLLVYVLIDMGGALVGIALLQWFSTGLLQRALARSRAAAADLQIEINERKQAEEALRASEQQVRQLNEGLERRVAERTAQLEVAYKELESFSYSVSHDLRAPLRAIDGFARILQLEYAPSLAPEGIQQLEVIRNNARQMSGLVDGLLTYVRLGRQPLDKRSLVPVELVAAALDSLRGEQEGRGVEFVVGEMPACQGDPTLMRQVWHNLLSNALKFTRGREVARIEVGCREQDGEQVYFVRDNGVGFDMQYAGKLFGVFQRLHPLEEFEGAGVGLATVQRIIQRHGGRIWAEGEPGVGATFYFTL